MSDIAEQLCLSERSVRRYIDLFQRTGAGPYAAFLKGGLYGGVAQTGMLWALAHSPPRGVWGHAPPENFGNLDSLRVILRHSDSDLQ